MESLLEHAPALLQVAVRVDEGSSSGEARARGAG